MCRIIVFYVAGILFNICIYFCCLGFNSYCFIAGGRVPFVWIFLYATIYVFYGGGFNMVCRHFLFPIRDILLLIFEFCRRHVLHCPPLAGVPSSSSLFLRGLVGSFFTRTSVFHAGRFYRFFLC